MQVTATIARTGAPRPAACGLDLLVLLVSSANARKPSSSDLASAIGSSQRQRSRNVWATAPRGHGTAHLPDVLHAGKPTYQEE